MPTLYGPGALAGAGEAGIRNAGPRAADTRLKRQAQALGTRLVLRVWRPPRRNPLHGFVDVVLLNGLEIDDIAVHVRGGRAWASLPARPVLEDGRHVIRDGKPAYVRSLAWRSRDLADEFSAAVVELIRRAYPDALDEVRP
jgi:hypothetical protein